MTPSHRFRNTVAIIAAGLALASGQPAAAQSMVSVQGKTLNMRSGPGTHTDILWELQKGYPLKVVSRKGNWLQVTDFENDRGWVARSLTGPTPYHVVKSRTAHVRQGPGTHHPIVGKAEYGDLFRTREKRPQWVRVERDDGKSGWIARSLLWGW